MAERTEELDPLSPTPFEVGINVLGLMHIVLVVLVVVQVLRGRTTVPHGVFGLFVLLFVPVVGPLLVLTWKGRVERHQARMQHSNV